MRKEKEMRIKAMRKMFKDGVRVASDDKTFEYLDMNLAVMVNGMVGDDEKAFMCADSMGEYVEIKGVNRCGIMATASRIAKAIGDNVRVHYHADKDYAGLYAVTLSVV